MAFPQPKKEEIYGFQTYFREVGYFITRREQYERGNLLLTTFKSVDKFLITLSYVSIALL